MKTFAITLNGNITAVKADYFKLQDNYVEFYTKRGNQTECVGVVKLGQSDMVCEKEVRTAL